jgi:hypothetical protein
VSNLPNLTDAQIMSLAAQVIASPPGTMAGDMFAVRLGRELDRRSKRRVGYLVVDGPIPAPFKATFRSFSEVEGVDDASLLMDARRALREAVRENTLHPEDERGVEGAVEAALYIKARQINAEGGMVFDEAYRWDGFRRDFERA